MQREQWQVDVDLPGQLAGSGRDTIEEQWAAYDLSAEVPFRDIDYASNPVERNVRVLDFSE